MGNFHINSIGEYKGDDISVIPDDASVEYTIMDAATYANTMLANKNKNDFFTVDPQKKIVIIQYYIKKQLRTPLIVRWRFPILACVYVFIVFNLLIWAGLVGFVIALIMSFLWLMSELSTLIITFANKKIDEKNKPQ